MRAGGGTGAGSGGIGGGRRGKRTASGGTDHGSASVALLFGDQLPSRLIGQYPSLSALDERGDLIPSHSPPELYRQVLQVAGG